MVYPILLGLLSSSVCLFTIIILIVQIMEKNPFFKHT